MVVVVVCGGGTWINLQQGRKSSCRQAVREGGEPTHVARGQAEECLVDFDGVGEIGDGLVDVGLGRGADLRRLARLGQGVDGLGELELVHDDDGAKPQYDADRASCD